MKEFWQKNKTAIVVVLVILAFLVVAFNKPIMAAIGLKKKGGEAKVKVGETEAKISAGKTEEKAAGE